MDCTEILSTVGTTVGTTVVCLSTIRNNCAEAHYSIMHNTAPHEAIPASGIQYWQLSTEFYWEISFCVCTQAFDIDYTPVGDGAAAREAAEHVLQAARRQVGHVGAGRDTIIVQIRLQGEGTPRTGRPPQHVQHLHRA